MQDSVLPQGCGGGVAPTSSHHPIYPFSPFSLQNLLRRFVTFGEILAIFRLLKTFLSYQQVINNETFSTQLLKLFSANEQIFERNAEAHKKCITHLGKKR